MRRPNRALDAAAWSHLEVNRVIGIDSPLDLARDDLAREVYCVLGVPIDAVGMSAALERVDAAASGTAPFLVSTPNLNFLATSQEDVDFREHDDFTFRSPHG
jgi:hypothetical protein